jgi:hypothetical protein
MMQKGSCDRSTLLIFCGTVGSINDHLRPESGRYFALAGGLARSSRSAIRPRSIGAACRKIAPVIALPKNVRTTGSPVFSFASPVVEKPGAARVIKHRRGPSTPRHKRCVTRSICERSAQDDVFVRGLKKNIPSKVALRTNVLRQHMKPLLTQLHPQKENCSANLDSSEIQPSLRDSFAIGLTHIL